MLLLPAGPDEQPSLRSLPAAVGRRAPCYTEAMTQAPFAKAAPTAPLYERDLHAWSQEQAALLRAGRLHEIDAENIAEEILDVGRNEYDKLESALRVLLTHMLKWDHQPERRSRSWENTMAEQRRRAQRQLGENPSLKPRLEEAIREGYWSARRQASSEMDVNLGTFPESCPYDWQAITTRPFEREGDEPA